MLDQKYRVRVNREPFVAGDKKQARNKKLLLYGGIGGGVVLIILLVLLFVGRGGSEPIDTSGPAELTVRLERGTAEIQTAEASDFSDLRDGEEVPEGATIRTDSESLLSMELSTGSVVRLNEKTRVELKTINRDDLIMDLVGGEAWTFIAQEDATPVTLQTLELKVRASGSVYDTSHGEDQTTVSVIDDRATVTALGIEEGQDKELGSTELRSGEKTTVAADELPGEESDFTVEDIADEFVESFWYRWNVELDEAYGLRVSGEEDTTGPDLKITSPKDDIEVSEDKVEIKGVTEVSATVKVDGKKAENDLGEFKAEVELEEGANKIEVVAEDAAGNKTKKEITVTRKPKAPDSVSFTLSSNEPGSVELSWNQSQADDFESYDVRRNGSTINTVTDIGATFFKDTGLEEGQSYTYVVCVIDTDGLATCSDEKTATVKSKPNEPPTISIIEPGIGETVNGGAAITFSASGNDPEGTPLTFNWEFGDGQTATGQTVTHVYLAPTETVTLTVFVTVLDGDGATANTSLTLTVTP